MSIQNRDEILGKIIEVLSRVEDFPDNVEVDEKWISDFRFGLNYVYKKVERCIPELVFDSFKEPLVGTLIQAQRELNSFIANHNVGHLSNASSHIPALLNQSNSLQCILSDSEVDSYGEVVAGRIQELRKLVNDMRDTNAKLQAGLNEKYSELDQKKDALAKEIESYLSVVAKAVDGFHSQVQDKSDQIKNIEVGFQKDFVEGESKRETAALKQRNDFEKSAMDAIKNTKERLRRALDEDAAPIIKDIENLKLKASNILEIMSGSAMANDFAKTANEEEGRANILRWIAGIAWLAVAGSTFYLITNIEGTPNLGAIFGKISAVAMLAAPATYFTIAENGHRREARRARRYSLELVALEPYLASVNEKERQAKLLELTGKYFGQVNDVPKGEEDITPILKTIKLFSPGKKK